MPAFYNVGVGRRRIPRERERWLSAVLIVIAIVGMSAAVRFWPVSLPSPAPRLASRPLHLIEAPALPTPVRLVMTTPERAHPPSPEVRVEEAPVVLADVPITAPEVAVVSDDVTDASPDVIPLLASRRLEIPSNPPAVNHRREPAAVAPAGSHAIMELPAVAVTRVVTVAGRGMVLGDAIKVMHDRLMPAAFRVDRDDVYDQAV